MPFGIMISSSTKVELHLSFRALSHRKREGIIRRASLKYPDAWIRSSCRSAPELLGSAIGRQS
eukprot:2290863-Pyramimonas_sp.AAC.1